MWSINQGCVSARGLILTGSLALASCVNVGLYNPDPQSAVLKKPGYTIPLNTTITNVQPSKKEHYLEFGGIIVNYHDFTQAVVKALEEHKRSDSSLAGEKELRVKVTFVESTPDAFTYRGDIIAVVAFGDVGKEEIRSSRASYGSGFNATTAPTRPLDSAFKDLVANILKNEKIRAYLDN
jgi:hypothetical protein